MKKLGDLLKEKSPVLLEQIVSSLDQYGRDFDRYEFGLPHYGGKETNDMVQLIVDELNNVDIKL